MSERGALPLFLGAVAGALVAARGVVRPAPGPPEGVAALIDGRPVLRADLDRALSAVAADRRDGVVPPELRRRVLDRLIDEELLLSRGLALGLPSRDPRVRAELVSAMLDLVARTGDEPPPTEAELRAFHGRDPARFARPAWVHTRAARFEGDIAVAARRARLASSSGRFEDVAAAADRSPLPLPDGPVPARKLADYLGPEAAALALSLPPGEMSPPIPARSGVWVLLVVDREGAAAPAYDDVRDDVVAAFRRDADERKLRAWLDRQRASSRVVVAP